MNFLLQLFVPKLIKLLLDEAEDSLNDKDKPECTKEWFDVTEKMLMQVAHKKLGSRRPR